MNTENEKLKDTSEMRSGRGGGRGSHGGRGRGKGRAAGRKSGRRRPLAHGDLRLLILSIVAETPSHGYGLISKIKDKTSGFYAPSPGVIYPAIEALQDLEWAQVKPDNGKRILHITDAGKAELARESKAIDAIQTRLSNLAAADGPASGPDDVRGAMGQLRHATVAAVKGTPDDGDIRKAAVKILQEARKKIDALVTH